MSTISKSVLPVVAEPQPLTPIKVRRTDEGRRLIRFHATQDAIREIRRKGFGILNQKPDSGWCVLVVNECYDFLEVYDYLINLQAEAFQNAA